MDRPKITHVAIRFQNQVWSLPSPYRHHDIIRTIVWLNPDVQQVDTHGEDQGFLDESGRYLTRKQALISAQLNDQVKDDCLGAKLGELYSEDVW